MHNMLTTLLDRPTFEEEYPDQYQQARIIGKKRMDAMDKLRGGMCFADTLNEQTRKWWNEIS